MEIVDSQVHLNRLGANWVQAPYAQTIESGIIAMDALSVHALLIDERSAIMMGGEERHAQQLPNGALRYRAPFSEQAVATYPDRFAYLTRIDRRDPDMPDIIADARQKPGLVALRIEPVPETGEIEPFIQGMYKDYFAAAQKHGIPIFVWTGNRMEILIPYLTKFPDLQIIVDHCGVALPPPETLEDRFAQLDRVIAMARFPNLSLKWCKAANRVSMQSYPYLDLEPYLRRIVDAFGPQRVMWASDNTQTWGPNSSDKNRHHRWAQSLFSLLHSNVLDQTEKEWLLGRSVRTTLHWLGPGQ